MNIGIIIGVYNIYIYRCLPKLGVPFGGPIIRTMTGTLTSEFLIGSNKEAPAPPTCPAFHNLNPKYCGKGFMPQSWRISWKRTWKMKWKLGLYRGHIGVIFRI